MKRIQIITGAAALLAALTACTSPKQGQPTTDTGPDRSSGERQRRHGHRNRRGHARRVLDMVHRLRRLPQRRPRAADV